MRLTAYLLGAVTLYGSAFSTRVHAQEPYQDRTVEAGFPARQASDKYRVAGSIGLLDYDGDDDLDVLLTMGSTDPPALFRNDSEPGAPLFTDVTEESGLAAIAVGSMAFGIGDFDRDGDEDVYIGQPHRDVLLFNDGAGGFEDVTDTHLQGWAGRSHVVGVADFDSDGDLDVAVGQYIAMSQFPFHTTTPAMVLVNDGQGRLSDQAVELGVIAPGSALSLMWSDADSDGDLDLLITNDFGQFVQANQAFRNDGPDESGAWRFTDASALWGFDRRVYGMGIGVTDTDGDGSLDYFMTSIGRHILLRGPAEAGFVDATDAAGVDSTYTDEALRASWGVAALDVDADGREELYVSSGFEPASGIIRNSNLQPDLLWHFQDDGTAVDLGPRLLPETSYVGRGVVAADLDGDYAPDLFVGAGQDRPLFLTGGGVARHLHVMLEATVSAPGAPGTWLRMECGAETYVKQLIQSGGLGSANALGHVWMGVPADCPAPDLELEWPSGYVQRFEGLSANTTLVAEEPEFLRLEPRVLTVGSDALAVLEVSPRDAGGALLGAGLEVTARVGGDDPVALSDEGDGRYVLAIGAPASPGEQRIEVRVDGETLRARPVLAGVAPDDLDWWMYPTLLVPGIDSVVSFRVPEGSAGPYAVRVDDTFALAEVDARGRARAAFRAERSATGVRFVAIAGESELGPAWDVPSAGFTSPALNTVRIHTPYLAEPRGSRTTFELTSLILDPMRMRYPLTDPTGVLERDGEPLDVEFGTADDGRFVVSIPFEELDYGQEYALTFDGVPAHDPVTIRGYPSAAVLAGDIDPEQSMAGAFFESCEADGQDVLVMSALLRNDQAHTMPLIAGIGLAVDGGELIGAPRFTSGRYYFDVRCGTEPGIGYAEVTYNGVGTGVGWEFELRPPLVPAHAPARTVVIGPGEVLPLGAVGEVRVRPRTSASLLVGSGLDVDLRSDSALTIVSTGYCQIGNYCFQVRGPERGGPYRVEAVIDGVPTGVSAPIEWERPDGGEPDPAPDLGFDADLGTDATGVTDAALADDADADATTGLPDAGDDGGGGRDVRLDASRELGHGGDFAGDDLDAGATDAGDDLGGPHGEPDADEPDLVEDARPGRDDGPVGGGDSGGGADSGSGGAGVDEDGSGQRPLPGDCGCSVSRPSGAAPYWFLTLLGVFMARRRRWISSQPRPAD
jgi:MYXO-CTERM domain-containing protein